MKKKPHWNLPFDERLIPDIFSFQYPKSPWVRGMLFAEMLFAIVAVIGTLFLVVMPRTASTPPGVSASSSSPTTK